MLALALAQLLLPGIAADQVRSRVQRYGRVRSVTVSAFPALELLWGRAESAHASVAHMAIAPPQVAGLLWEAKGVHTLRASAASVLLEKIPGLAGGLGMSGGVLRKDGPQIEGEATFTQAQLDAAMPAGVSVVPQGSDSEGVHIAASGSLFGLRASIPALVEVVEGRVVAVPQGIPFGGLAAVVLFSDAHLKVQSLQVTVLGGRPRAYRLKLVATLL